MLIEKLNVGYLQTNCYIIGCESTQTGAVIDLSAPVPIKKNGLLLLTIQVSEAMGRVKRQVFCRAAGNQADTSADPIPLSPPKFKVDQTQTGWRGFWKNIKKGWAYNRGSK